LQKKREDSFQQKEHRPILIYDVLLFHPPYSEAPNPSHLLAEYSQTTASAATRIQQNEKVEPTSDLNQDKFVGLDEMPWQ